MKSILKTLRVISFAVLIESIATLFIIPSSLSIFYSMNDGCSGDAANTLQAFLDNHGFSFVLVLVVVASIVFNFYILKKLKHTTKTSRIVISLLIGILIILVGIYAKSITGYPLGGCGVRLAI